MVNSLKLISVLFLCSSVCFGSAKHKATHYQYLLPPSCNAVSNASSNITVCFSPNYGGDNCLTSIMNEINKATNSIFVQAYVFTSLPIIDCLVGSAKKGVRVEVIIDKSVSSYLRYIESLVSNSILVRVDRKHAISHNKIMIIDGLVVITGSYNFTKAAECSNAENLLIIRDSNMAKKYRDNFEIHKLHSEVL